MEEKTKQTLKLTADLAWCTDILERVKAIIDADYITPEEKIDGIAWLINQGLKVKREE